MFIWTSTSLSVVFFALPSPPWKVTNYNKETLNQSFYEMVWHTKCFWYEILPFCFQGNLVMKGILFIISYNDKNLTWSSLFKRTNWCTTGSQKCVITCFTHKWFRESRLHTSACSVHSEKHTQVSDMHQIIFTQKLLCILVSCMISWWQLPFFPVWITIKSQLT